MKILILNGPNLNLLGIREPDLYGSESMEDIFKALQQEFTELELEYYQSNIEGEIINKLHACSDFDGILLNAGGYTHTSVAIGDAVAGISAPVIEIHISNVYARESFRHESKMAKHCKGIIVGFGTNSYRLGLRALLD